MSLIPGSQQGAGQLNWGFAHPSSLPSPPPRASSVELGRTVQWFNVYKDKKGTLETWVGWVFKREELSAGKLGDKARSGSTLNLTPIHPTTIPAPEREGNVLPSGTALGLSRLRSEWPLPGPESATSSPENKHSNVGNGRWGLPNRKWGTQSPQE